MVKGPFLGSLLIPLNQRGGATPCGLAGGRPRAHSAADRGVGVWTLPLNLKLETRKH